eukprot:jgi/Mesen1/2580/ME000163S01600
MSTSSTPHETSLTQGVGPTKKPLPKKVMKKKPPQVDSGRRATNGSSDRTVRRLRLSKALTIPDTTTVADAARRMAARRTDAALLTDSTKLLCGIITDKDLALRVVAEGLNVDETPVGKIMTKNPQFVSIDSSAVDALQKMASGRFRHLPVVENNEVVALLDITKCLYDAIARMERAAEKGNALAAAMEGVERQWGNTATTPSNLMQTLRERMFRPTLSTIVGDSPRLAVVQLGDTVSSATKKMREHRASSVIVISGDSLKPIGILTSKDVLMRVMALSLRPEGTLVEKVMTPNPECAPLDSSIVDALHTMHDGKFLHLPVVNKDGNAVACVDVIQLTHGAVATAVGSSVGAAAGQGGMESSGAMMQKFWDSALALEPADTDEDVTSVRSSDISEHPAFYAHDTHGTTGSTAGSRGGLGPHFGFKMNDKRGRTHRFTCGTHSLTELVVAVAARLGSDYNPDLPPSILYEDEEGDKVMLTTDEDLTAAITFARTSTRKDLKLYLDYTGDEESRTPAGSEEPVSSDLPPKEKEKFRNL